MAALPTQDRADITAEAQRTPECPGGLTKAQLRAVVDAAIPQPQRGILSARQKAFLFQRVLERRYKVS